MLRRLPNGASDSISAYLLCSAYLWNDQAAEADQVLARVAAEHLTNPRWLRLQWEIEDRLAVGYADEILRNYPDSAGSHLLKAQRLDAEGNPEAEQEYLLAIGADPQRSEIRITLTDYYLGRSNLPAALRTAAEELQVSPFSSAANMRLGRVYLQMGQPRQALPYLQTALNAEPQNAVLRADLGKAWETLEEYGKAVSEYKESLRLDPGQIRLHYLLAKLYGKLGQPASAQKEMAQFNAAQEQQQQKLLEQARVASR
jgi:tetratricopeptide (TPR) repeat protein